MLYRFLIGLVGVEMQQFTSELKFADANQTKMDEMMSPDITLEREPDNDFDTNAVQVIASTGCIGYLSREVAAQVAPLMDAGTPVKAHLSAFRTEYSERTGKWYSQPSVEIVVGDSEPTSSAGDRLIEAGERMQQVGQGVNDFGRGCTQVVWSVFFLIFLFSCLWTFVFK